MGTGDGAGRALTSAQRPDYPRLLISDEMWKLLDKHLEEIRDGRGTKPEQSQREFLEAVLYLVRTGDLPEPTRTTVENDVETRMW